MTPELATHLPQGDLEEAAREAERQRRQGKPGHRTLTANLAQRWTLALANANPTGHLRATAADHLNSALAQLPLESSLRARLEAALYRELAAQPPANRRAPARDEAAAAHDADHHHADLAPADLEQEAEEASAAPTSPPPDLDADLQALWDAPPPPGLGRRRPESQARGEELRAALDAAGHALAPHQLDILSRLWSPSAKATRWLVADRVHVERLLAHAEHHCGAACRSEPETLDPETRAQLAATTGIDVGPVPVVRRPDLGREGETDGAQIRLAPELGLDPTGRHVRLHEAAHVAQSRLAGPVADPDLVEAEASEIAHAAERGERVTPGLRAGAGAHGISFPDLSPMGLLRRVAPSVAQLIDEGLEGQIAKIGSAVNGAVRTILDGLGISRFINAFQTISNAVKPGSLGFGILNGCCDCFDTALEKMLGGLERFLASDSAQQLQRSIAASQQAEKNQFLDTLTDVFALLKKVGGPVLSFIEGVGHTIEAAKRRLGALANKVWRFICERLGLDASLPPLEAIKKKLQQLWERAARALAPLRNAIRGALDWLKNSSPLAPLFRIAGDLRKLVGAIKKCVAAKARGGKAWLAMLAKELAGTVFEPMITALQAGQRGMTAAATAVTSWFRSMLEKLGFIEAWNSSVSFIRSLIATVQRFVASVKSRLTALGTKIGNILKEIGAAAKKIYDATKPYLDFVVGFAMAAAASAGGNIFAFPMFLLGNLWLHVLPDCYKESILNFILRAFIALVEWYPAAGMPMLAMIRAAALSFLRTMLADTRQRKIKAMDTVASLFAGNIELVAGLVVGVFKGIYESTIGTVVWVFQGLGWLAGQAVDLVSFAATPMVQLIGDAADFLRSAGEDEEAGGEATAAGAAAAGNEATQGAAQAENEGENESENEADNEGAGSSEEEGDDSEPMEDGGVEVGEEESDGEAPDDDGEPDAGGNDEAVIEGEEGEEAQEQGGEGGEPRRDEPNAANASAGEDTAEPAAEDAADDGEQLDPAPAMPDDLGTGRALFDTIFRDGVTRADLESLLASFSLGLEQAGATAGQKAAKGIIDGLNRDDAAYKIGEAVGTVVGMVVAEIVIAYFTAGVGLAKTAVTLTKVAVTLAKHLPNLFKMVRLLARVAKPILATLRRFRKAIGAWAAKVEKYLDDLVKWGQRALRRLIARARRMLGRRPRRPRSNRPRPNRPRRRRPRRRGDRDLLAAATLAASRGWAAMGSLDGAVHSLAAVQAKLRTVRVPRKRGTSIRLSLASRRSGWKVKASARKGARRASAKAGHGWITRAHRAPKAKFYATRSYAAHHRQLLETAAAAIQAADARADSEQKGTRQQYDIIKREAAQQAQQGQSRISLRGIRFDIDVEPWTSADQDKEVTTELIISPNAATKTIRTRINARNKYDATATRGSTSANYNVRGPWAKIYQFHTYPGSNGFAKHPVNTFGPGLNTPRRPQDNYALVKGQRSGGGSRFSAGWYSHMLSRREEQEATLPASMPRAQRRQQAQNLLVAEYQGNGFPHLRTWAELALEPNSGHGWEGHHVEPINWGGDDDKSNICFLPRGQHSQFSSFFQLAKNGLLADVYH